MRRVLSVDVGEKHYAVCALTIGDDELGIVYLRTHCLGLPQACPASARVDRVVDTWNRFESEWMSDWVPDAVLIEQQMRVAHANVAIAFATYTWFRTKHPSVSTRFVRPCQKLTAWRSFCPPEKLIVPPLESGSGYYSRKRFAVAVCEEILRTYGHPSLDHFAQSCGGKKDDLADAFLQSFCVFTT